MIPQDWLDGLSLILNETYETQCKENERDFDVYGQIYDEELLIIVSWHHTKDEFAAPITCFLSAEPEQMSSDKKVKDVQKHFTDIIGLFFDEIFNDSEWDGFEPNWQEVKYKTETYFYKISRENITLTLEANKLLGDDFEEA
jgi:hypothetical protein